MAMQTLNLSIETNSVHKEGDVTLNSKSQRPFNSFFHVYVCGVCAYICVQLCVCTCVWGVASAQVCLYVRVCVEA